MISPTESTHIGLAVPDLDAACEHLARCFGARLSAPKDVPEQKLRMRYATFGTVTVELMTPTHPDSPISRFLERNPGGGIHHLALGVADAAEAAEGARAAGLRIVGPGEPRPGHHGRPIFFLNPNDTLGALIEIEQQMPEASRPPAVPTQPATRETS